MKNDAIIPREAISLDESARFIELEKTIEHGKQAVFEFASALEEIREKRLYRADHATFEQYCKARWDFGKAYANHLIRAAGVVKSLPPNLATLVATETQARELGKFPVPVRADVIAEIVESGQPVTAKAIRSIRPVPIQPEKPLARDQIGWPIPPGILDNWIFAEREGRDAWREIGRWKSFFGGLQEKKHPIYAEVNCNSVFADLSNAWTQAKLIIPFAVCLKCQGLLPTDCPRCKGRGFVSEFHWKNIETAEDKEFRLKLVRAGA